MLHASNTLERPVPHKLRLLASYDKETFQSQAANEVIISSIVKIRRELETYGVSHWLLLKPLARCVGNILTTTQDSSSVEKHLDTLCALFTSCLIKADSLSKHQVPVHEKEQLIVGLIEEIQLMLQSNPKMKTTLLQAFLQPLLGMILKYKGRTLHTHQELLSMVCNLLRSVNRDLRSQLRHLYYDEVVSIIAFLDHCGDYDIQQGLLEVLIRLTPSDERLVFAQQMFECAKYTDLALVFQELGSFDFENECRTFLSILNLSLRDGASVFTFPCETIMLDNDKLHKPQHDKFKRLHVNFNTGTNSLSFWCMLDADNVLDQVMLRVNPSDVEDSYLLELDQKLLQLTLCLHKPLTQVEGTNLAKATLMRLVFKIKHLQIVTLAKTFFANTIRVSESIEETMSSQESPMKELKKRPKVSEGVRIQSSQEYDDAGNMQTETAADENEVMCVGEFSAAELQLDEDLLQTEIIEVKSLTPRIQLSKKTRKATPGIPIKTKNTRHPSTPQARKTSGVKRVATPGVKRNDKKKEESEVKCSQGVSCYPNLYLKARGTLKNVEELLENPVGITEVYSKLNINDEPQPENVETLVEQAAKNTKVDPKLDVLVELQPENLEELVEKSANDTNVKPKKLQKKTQPQSVEEIEKSANNTKVDPNLKLQEKLQLENVKEPVTKNTKTDPKSNTKKYLKPENIKDLLEELAEETEDCPDLQENSAFESVLQELSQVKAVEYMQKKQNTKDLKEKSNPMSRHQLKKTAAKAVEPKVSPVKNSVTASDLHVPCADKAGEFIEASAKVQEQTTGKPKAKRGRKPSKTIKHITCRKIKLRSTMRSMTLRKQDNILTEKQSLSQKDDLKSKKTKLPISVNKAKAGRPKKSEKTKSCAEEKEAQSNDKNALPCEENWLTEVKIPQREETTEVKMPQREETTEVEMPQREETTEVEMPQREETTEVEMPQGEETTDVEMPLREETTEVEMPQGEETTEVEMPLREETTEVEMPQGEETTEVEMPLREETTEVEMPQEKEMTTECVVQEINAAPQLANVLSAEISKAESCQKEVTGSSQKPESDICNPVKTTSGQGEIVTSDFSDQETRDDLPYDQHKETAEMNEDLQEKVSNKSWEKFMNQVQVSKYSPYPSKNIISGETLQNKTLKNASCLFEDLHSPKLRLSGGKNRPKQSKKSKKKKLNCELPHVEALNSSKTPLTVTPGKRRLYNPATPHVEAEDNTYTMQINQDFKLKNSLHIQINLPSTLNINSKFSKSGGDFSQWKQTNNKPTNRKMYTNKKKCLMNASASQSMDSDTQLKIGEISEVSTQESCALFAEPVESKETKQPKTTNRKLRAKKVTTTGFAENVTQTEKPDVLRMTKKSNSSVINALSKVWTDEDFEDLPDLVIEKRNKMKSPFSTPPFLKEKPAADPICEDKIQTPEESVFQHSETSPIPVTKQAEKKSYHGKPKTQSSKEVVATPTLKTHKRKDVPLMKILKKKKPTVAKVQTKNEKKKITPESEGMAVFKEKKVVKKRQPKPSETGTSQETVWEKPVKSQREAKKREVIISNNCSDTRVQDKSTFARDASKQENIKENVPRDIYTNVESQKNQSVKEVEPVQVMTQEAKTLKVVLKKGETKGKKVQAVCEKLVLIPESSSVASSQSVIDGTQLEYSAPSMFKSLKVIQNTAIKVKTANKTVEESSPVSSEPSKTMIPCQSEEKQVFDYENVPVSSEEVPAGSKQDMCRKSLVDKSGTDNVPVISKRDMRLKSLGDKSETQQVSDSDNVLVISKRNMRRKSLGNKSETQQVSDSDNVLVISKRNMRRKSLGDKLEQVSDSDNEDVPRSKKLEKHRKSVLVKPCKSLKQQETESEKEYVPTSKVKDCIFSNGNPRKSLRVRKPVRQQKDSESEEMDVESRKRYRRRALLPRNVINQTTSAKLCSTALSELEDEEGEQPPCKKLNISLSPILEDGTSDLEQDQPQTASEKRLYNVSKQSKNAPYLEELTNVVLKWTEETSQGVASNRCEVLRRFCDMLQLETEQAEQRLQNLQIIQSRQLKAERFMSNTVEMLEEVMTKQHTSTKVLQKQSSLVHHKLMSVDTDVEKMMQQLMTKVSALQEEQHLQVGEQIMENLRSKISDMFQ